MTTLGAQVVHFSHMLTGKQLPMWKTRRVVTLLALSLLAACTPLQQGSSPVEADSAEGGEHTRNTSRSRPELTLNLPRNDRKGCDCAPVRDTTFFDRGLQALAEGRVVEATEHFRRYRRLEASPLARWESDVALAWVSMLPDSPFYDRDAVVTALAALSGPPEGAHASAVLMLQALQSFAVMHRHLQDLEQVNSTLEQDLEKREEAIKRLRELTLGQSGAARP